MTASYKKYFLLLQPSNRFIRKYMAKSLRLMSAMRT